MGLIAEIIQYCVDGPSAAFENESQAYMAVINRAADQSAEIGGADVLATRTRMQQSVDGGDWKKALKLLREAKRKADRVLAAKPFLVAKQEHEPKIKAAMKIAVVNGATSKKYGDEVAKEWAETLELAKKQDFTAAARRTEKLAERIDGEIANALRAERERNKEELKQLKEQIQASQDEPEVARAIAMEIFRNTSEAEKLGVDPGVNARKPFTEEGDWTAQRCEAVFVQYDWFALKKCRKNRKIVLDKAEMTFTDDDMWKLVQYRGKVVNEVIDSLRTKYSTLIAKASGSEDVESDIDITFATPGSGDDVKAAQEFNAEIKRRFKKPPGRVFDVNIYPRDYGAIKESFKPDYNVDALVDEGIDEPDDAGAIKVSKIDQDVATLLKQRRFLDQERFDAMLDELIEQAPDDMKEKIRKQYEEGEDIYFLTSVEKVEKIRKQVDIDSVPEGKHKTELLEHLTELDSLQGEGGVDAAARAQFLVPVILDLFEELCPADTMDVTDALYLEKMGSLRQDQDSIRKLKNETAATEEQHPGQTCEQAGHTAETHDAWRKKLLNSLEIKVKKEMFTNIIFANEAIMSQGALKHVVEALQARSHAEKIEKLGKLKAEDLMQSVNEQVADLYKEIKHYEGELEQAGAGAVEPEEAKAAKRRVNGEGFVHASKYFFRLLDAAISLNLKFPDDESVNAPYAAVENKDLKDLKDDVDNVLLKLRKSAAIPPEVKGSVGELEMRELLPRITDVKSFREMITEFSIELNRRIRSLEEFKEGQALATEAEREAEKGYFEVAGGK